MSEPRYATGVFFTRCNNPNCRALHINLLDEEGCFASAAIGPEDMVKLTEHLHGIAYEIATEKDT